MSRERLVYVRLPYATYGLICRGGRIVEAPPIARWMIGRPENAIVGWLRRRGADIIVLS